MADGELTPLEVVEQWHLRAWQGDLDVVDELVAETLIRHNRDGTQQRSREDVKSDLSEYQKALGKPILEQHDRVADGDKVWSRTTLRGASLECGEPRTIDMLQIHRVEHGQIVEVWVLHAPDVDWT